MLPQALVASVGFLLERMGSESRRRFVQMLDRWDLRPSHFVLMTVLDTLESASQRQLGEVMGIDPRNLVAVVDLLDERELITRSPHPTDRRRHAVKLTPKGRALLAQLRQAGDELERDLLAPLDPSEQAALRALLLKLLPQVSPKG